MCCNHVLARGVLPDSLHEVRLHPTRIAFDRTRSAPDARDQALGGEHLEVAVYGDGRDRMLAGGLADRRTTVAPDVREDLGATALWRRLVRPCPGVALTQSM